MNQWNQKTDISCISGDGVEVAKISVDGVGFRRD